MPGLEQLLQELLRVAAHVAGGDPLLQPPDLLVTCSMNRSWCRASAETIAYDSSSGDARPEPAGLDPGAAPRAVSRSGTSAGTAGFTGPCTVIRYRSPTNWSSST